MLGILFSGGKDSVFATYYYLEQGWDVKCLISLQSENKSSWMFHTPAIELTTLQSEALAIPLIVQKTKGEKESELLDLKKALLRAKKKFKITGVALGALLSDYQHERVNRICHSLGLKCYAPLWHKEQERLLREIVSLGFDARIVGVASQGMGEEFLGKKIDEKMIGSFSDLHKKYDFHIAGEGGEYESFVVDGPIFKKRIELVKTKKVMGSQNSGILEIIEAKVVAK
ncbi:MAG TPA: diphthine--ammonia ligase [archaeon]|nr:diphthine--ammonia ligase [archaeon]